MCLLLSEDIDKDNHAIGIITILVTMKKFVFRNMTALLQHYLIFLIKEYKVMVKIDWACCVFYFWEGLLPFLWVICGRNDILSYHELDTLLTMQLWIITRSNELTSVLSEFPA